MAIITHPELGNLEVPDNFNTMSLQEQQEIINSLLNKGSGASLSSTQTSKGGLINNLGGSTEKPKTENKPAVVTEVEDKVKDGFTLEAALAGAISSTNGFLPIGDVQTIVGWFSPEAKDRLNQILEDNPTAATSGVAVGTVAGLITGPAGLAKQGGKAATGIVGKISQSKTKGTVRNQIDDVASKVSTKFEKDSIKKFDDEWAALERQADFSVGGKRDAFRSMLNSLPADSPLKGNVSNPFKTIFNNELDTASQVTGGTLKRFFQETGRDISHATQNRALDLASGLVNLTGEVGTDYAANYAWGYSNFVEQGYDDKKARELALYYAFDKSKEEMTAESIKLIIGNAGPIAKITGVGIESVKNIIRLTELDLEKGQIDASRYDEDLQAKNQGGLISRLGKPKTHLNAGGQASFLPDLSSNLLNQQPQQPPQSPHAKPQGLTTMLGEGKQAGPRRFSGITDQQVEDNNTSPWDLVDFIPIIGDIKGAYEVVQYLRKDPINWVVAGGLIAATIIGAFPGIGDAAGVAIKKAIQAAGASGKLVPADVVGILRAVKDGDVEFLKGWGLPENAKSVGAKAAKSKTYYVKNPDGTVQQFDGTAAEFREQFGVGLSGEKKKRGKTADGLEWSSTGEFKNFKTGSSATAAKSIDASALKFPEVGTKVQPPKSIPVETRNKFGRIVDEELVAADKKWYSAEEAMGNDPIPNTDDALEISQDAWAPIMSRISTDADFQNLSVDKQNNIWKWLKARSKNLIGSDRFPGAQMRLDGHEYFDLKKDLGVDYKGLVASEGQQGAQRIINNLTAGVEAGHLKMVDGKLVDTTASTASAPKTFERQTKLGAMRSSAPFSEQMRPSTPSVVVPKFRKNSGGLIGRLGMR